MSGQSGVGRRRLWVIVRLPLAIFAGTLGGLAVALLGEGAWRWLSWIMLSVPVAIIVSALGVRAPPIRWRAE